MVDSEQVNLSEKDTQNPGECQRAVAFRGISPYIFSEVARVKSIQ
jgi:hypothetical protein